MHLLSPAKINLFLRILRKRPDGYHELASLFQTVNLCDVLIVERASSDAFTCSEAIPGNLVLKALHLFREKTRVHFPLRIHLEKQIPMEAGLGGGSSNAATTLYALNELAERPLTNEQLALLGAELGSDVPFFFSSGTAYCTGRGEIFQNVSLPPAEYMISKPVFGSSTAGVYKAFELSTSSLIDPKELVARFQNNAPLFINDLEVPAFAINPALKEFKEALLKAGYENVMMSGSGSAFISTGKGLSVPSHFEKKVSTIKRKDHEWYFF